MQWRVISSTVGVFISTVEGDLKYSEGFLEYSAKCSVQ